MKNLLKTNNLLPNILFIFFPLSLILGTTIVNLNILLFVLSGFILYKKEIVAFKINFFDKIILSLAIYILLVLIINLTKNNFFIDSKSKYVASKTFAYYRFIALYFIIRILTERKILNLKWFGNIAIFLSTFICLDVIFQFFYGKDFFGIVSNSSRHNSGPFGEELIAGGFIQKFAIFTFFIPFFSNININKKIIIISFFLTGLILSGNRIPTIMFIFSLIFYFIFDKNLKKYTFRLFVIFLSLGLLILFSNKEIKAHITNIYSNGKILISSIFNKNLKEKPLEIWQKPYVTEFYCGKEVIKKNFFIGGGLRSYRLNFENCNTHPHNYYLEVFSDLGLYGFLTFVFIYFFLIYNILKKYILKNLLKKEYWPYFLILLVELFPLRTTGSVFTTKNSLILFITFAVLANLISNRKIINS